MFIKSCNTINPHGAVGSTIRDWYLGHLRDTHNKPLPAIKRLLTKGILLGFSRNDFINVSSYRGLIKWTGCNSTNPKYKKLRLNKELGWCTMLGFKIPDYDQSLNYLLVSDWKFLHVLKDKMTDEFVSIDYVGYPSELYLYDLQLQYPDLDIPFEYDRCWEYIRGLTPQEKIVLANKHDEDPFPNSYYENDRGYFSKKTQQDEFDIRLESITSDIDIRDYQGDESENAFDKVDKIISEREQSLIDSIKEGFDYGDFQDFSDIYTRTSTSLGDYELYPVRVNCLPKSVRKKGKSPYDTKLGVREWRWFNHYQKAIPLKSWNGVPHGSPKYDWELSEEEKLANEYDLPDNFWEEIEMAYQSR